MKNSRNKLRTYQLIIEIWTDSRNILESASSLPTVIDIIIKFVGSLKYLQSIEPKTLEYDDDGLCYGINWQITCSIHKGLGIYYERPNLKDLKQKLTDQFKDLSFHLLMNAIITSQFTVEESENNN